MNSTNKFSDNFQNHLIAFYYGTIDSDTRTLMEEKLLHSPRHLLEFLALKRSLEERPEGELLPSDSLRLRLKADVVELVGKTVNQSAVWHDFVRKRYKVFPSAKAWTMITSAVAAGILIAVFWQQTMFRDRMQSPPGHTENVTNHLTKQAAQQEERTATLSTLSIDAAGSVPVNLNYL